MIKGINLKKKLQAILATLFLAGSLSAQQQTAGENYIAIDLRLFSDSRGHWYGIHDDANIVNPVANQPTYPAPIIPSI